MICIKVVEQCFQNFFERSATPKIQNVQVRPCQKRKVLVNSGETSLQCAAVVTSPARQIYRMDGGGLAEGPFAGF